MQSLVPIDMFQGYQYVMWAFPFCQEGFGGVSPISLGVGASALEMFICSILYLFLSCIMSHVATTAPTTTPPVTVVSSGLSSVSSVTVAPSLTGFPVGLDQHGMVPPPPLIPRGS